MHQSCFCPWMLKFIGLHLPQSQHKQTSMSSVLMTAIDLSVCLQPAPPFNPPAYSTSSQQEAQCRLNASSSFILGD